ncbi:MAG: hypothetical protein ABEJ98_03515 [Candidatus Nanohaloarchaea archaeon]
MRVEKLLKRLKQEFWKVNLLQACLDAILFFLAANLGLFLFSLTVAESFTNLQALAFLSLLVFAADFAYRARNFRLELYEEENPELREILRTARDNLDANNIVSQAMFDELLDRSRSVTSDSIIPSRRIIQKIVAVGALSFLTVASGLADFQVIQQGGNIIPENPLEQVTGGGEKKGFQLKNSSEIYGEPQQIKVSDRLVNFSIRGSGKASETELGSAPGEADFRMVASPGSMPEDVELAREYSLAIKGFD